jgi:hypothetical protein
MDEDEFMFAVYIFIMTLGGILILIRIYFIDVNLTSLFLKLIPKEKDK